MTEDNVLVSIGDVKKFYNEEEGATAVEYAIMASAIAAVIVVVAVAVGVKVGGLFGDANTSMTDQGM